MPISIEDTGLNRRLASPEPSGVLVVDDDELVRMHTASLLRSVGYDVHDAASGQEALLRLASEPCQIVITDWDMPGMDGLELCRALRARSSDTYIYVLMLTRFADQRDILLGLGAGADDYLVKGVSPQEMLARVEVARRITRLERSLRETGAENGRLSITDPLTGARNRRFLMKYLPRELERARRYARPLALISCDIDDFKRVNDRFGHEAGDQVLRAFVERCTGVIRESIDWIARSGGEEFMIVAPETPLREAGVIAERVRRIIGGRCIPTSSGPLGVTVSIGVTAVETVEELERASVTELLRAADNCLYASKLLGRDRTMCVSPSRAASAFSIAAGRHHNEIN